VVRRGEFSFKLSSLFIGPGKEGIVYVILLALHRVEERGGHFCFYYSLLLYGRERWGKEERWTC